MRNVLAYEPSCISHAVLFRTGPWIWWMVPGCWTWAAMKPLKQQVVCLMRTWPIGTRVMQYENNENCNNCVCMMHLFSCLLIFPCRKIYPIHPKFRLIGVGETHKSSANQSGSSPSVASWLSPELLSMFHFHHVRPLPVEQEKQIIRSKVRSGRVRWGRMNCCLGAWAVVCRILSFRQCLCISTSSGTWISWRAVGYHAQVCPHTEIFTRSHC